MVQDVVYRLLTPHDAEGYHKARLQCLRYYADYFGDSYEEELVIGTTRFMKEFVSDESCSFLYGAFSAKTLIGTCGFLQQKRIKTRHRGDLVQLYIDPSFAGGGIGSKLVQLTIEKAFENSVIDQILLSVVYSNSKAIGLYKKFGFVQYGLIENYFKKDNKSSSQLFMVLTREEYEIKKVNEGYA